MHEERDYWRLPLLLYSSVNKPTYKEIQIKFITAKTQYNYVLPSRAIAYLISKSMAQQLQLVKR